MPGGHVVTLVGLSSSAGATQVTTLAHGCAWQAGMLSRTQKLCLLARVRQATADLLPGVQSLARHGARCTCSSSSSSSKHKTKRLLRAGCLQVFCMYRCKAAALGVWQMQGEVLASAWDLGCTGVHRSLLRGFPRPHQLNAPAWAAAAAAAAAASCSPGPSASSGSSPGLPQHECRSRCCEVHAAVGVHATSATHCCSTPGRLR
jgi:hypothetical protein